jgi:hypothetical protein
LRLWVQSQVHTKKGERERERERDVIWEAGWGPGTEKEYLGKSNEIQINCEL